MMTHTPQRNTKQRQIILGELRKLHSHPTAATIYETVRRRLPKISLGTVYRNLDLLTRTGIIQKLEFGGDEARFDGNPAAHDHVRCVKCGNVDDIHLPKMNFMAGAADFHGYSLLGRRVEFFGVCPQCNDSRQPITGAKNHAEF